MKKLITCLAAASITLFSFAQKIKVEEQNENIGGGKHNALVVTIYEASKDDIEKEWKSLMKDNNAKVSIKDEVFADNAVIKSINGNNTLDVYARAEKPNDKGEMKFIVGFDLGGAYLNSGEHKEAYKAAREMVYNFAVKMTKDAIGGQLKTAQKLLEKMQDQQKDLEKDKAGLEKDIESYKNKIKKAEDDIKTNLASQEKKKTEIATQQKVVDDVKKKSDAVN